MYALMKVLIDVELIIYLPQKAFRDKIWPQFFYKKQTLYYVYRLWTFQFLQKNFAWSHHNIKYILMKNISFEINFVHISIWKFPVHNITITSLYNFVL